MNLNIFDIETKQKCPHCSKDVHVNEAKLHIEECEFRIKMAAKRMNKSKGPSMLTKPIFKKK